MGPNLGVLETLTAQDPATGKVGPGLASSWTISPDATSFTFHLYDGVTFSDGSPFTADIVKANFENIQKLGPTASNSGAYLAGLTSITAPDQRTVTVAFAKPNIQFLQATSAPALSILSTGSLAGTAADRCTGKIVGTGPFILSSYIPHQNIVLSKRPDYKLAPSTAQHTGAAYLDKIDIRIVSDVTTRTGSLLSGQLDATNAVAPQDEARFDGNGFSVISRTLPGVVLSLYVNEKKTILQDQNVRLAIQKAINRADIVSTLYSPHYKPATSVLSSTTPGYTDFSSQLTYDPITAKRLLDSAGWTVGPDGIRVRGGQKLALDVIFGQPQSLELVQQQLKQVGIQLNLRQLQISQIQPQLVAGNYDLFLGNSSRADPDVLRTLFKQFAIVGSDSPALTAALSKQAESLDPAARQQAVTDAQKIVVSNAHVVPITEFAQVVGQSSKVNGLSFAANSSVRFYDAWLS
ncbi:ABC transporter substrate-binding protein [Frankia gtarii]|uniref:ABC transporter substrate-binding protein n=1 Tax=Frankia gtarii TaxID=2950102 RepID=UPI0021BEE3B7|nr:ABC transporter substrate-binding protein [Frankia gtarii]